MKRLIIMFLTLPLVVNAQAANNGFNVGGIVGSVIGLVLMFLIFLAIRSIVLWYWKVDTIIRYQEENVTGLQSIYNSNQQILKAIEAQTKVLIELNSKLDKQD